MTDNPIIKNLTPSDRERWDKYVNKTEQATFFHRAGWQEVLERAFNHRTHFLFAQEGGCITGVLPLAEVKSWLFGHSLVSTPFCVYGGVVADNERAEQALVQHACQLADTLNVDYLELRNRERRQPGWPCKDLYFTFRREISADEDSNLKAIPRKQRAVVRKSMEFGLDTQFDTSVDSFFTAYSTSVRNLGTPVFSKRYFKVLAEVFSDCSDILTIRKEGALVASVMNFYHKDEVLPYYGGGTDLARTLKGNDHMYWRLMCHAASKGVRIFDYGRSKQGTGSFSFKKNWGFEPQPLFYEYYLVKATQMPDLNPLNPKYQLLIRTWKRLPLFVSQLIGPLVSKYLG